MLHGTHPDLEHTQVGDLVIDEDGRTLRVTSIEVTTSPEHDGWPGTNCLGTVYRDVFAEPVDTATPLPSQIPTPPIFVPPPPKVRPPVRHGFWHRVFGG